MIEAKKLKTELTRLDNTLVSIGLTSRELSTARTKAQEAVMWSGKLLGEVSDTSSYKNDGKRKTIFDIEERFDDTEEAYELEGEKIAKVDELREKFQTVFESWKEIENICMGFPDNVVMDLSLINLASRIMEARMWLGMELGRMRDTAKKYQV